MKLILSIASILAVTHYALAFSCSTTPQYATQMSSYCAAGDIGVLWPYYPNPGQYVRCQGVGNPVLETCPNYTLFYFGQQKCARCSEYIPFPPCESVTAKSNCQKLAATPTPAPSTPVPLTTCVDNSKSYTSTFVPTCIGNDVYKKFPNYQNELQYYECQGLYNPLIKNCPVGTYFSYYEQACAVCADYVQNPPCEQLIFDKSNKCTKK